MLSNMFNAFDKLTDRFSVYKVETIGEQLGWRCSVRRALSRFLLCGCGWYPSWLTAHASLSNGACHPVGVSAA